MMSAELWMDCQIGAADFGGGGVVCAIDAAENAITARTTRMTGIKMAGSQELTGMIVNDGVGGRAQLPEPAAHKLFLEMQPDR